jgi:hypothetical protein
MQHPHEVSVDGNRTLVVFVSARSMRNHINMTIRISFRASGVAKATRHGRFNQGCVFNLGASESYGGNNMPEVRLDKLEVSS